MGYYTKTCFDSSSEELFAKNHSDKDQMTEGQVMWLLPTPLSTQFTTRYSKSHFSCLVCAYSVIWRSEYQLEPSFLWITQHKSSCAHLYIPHNFQILWTISTTFGRRVAVPKIQLIGISWKNYTFLLVFQHKGFIVKFLVTKCKRFHIEYNNPWEKMLYLSASNKR